ncbi:MAG: hypothetical protein J5994_08960 [Ruminococcus sp.]|nr:hypothetical protein [Ruminococcus sp.]
MFQTVVSLFDVFRTDIFPQPQEELPAEAGKFSTDPADYLSEDGFYI